MKWLPLLCVAGPFGLVLVHSSAGCVSHSCEDLATCETPGTGGSGTGTNTGGSGANGGGGVGGSGTGTATGTGSGTGTGTPFMQEPTLGLGSFHSCVTTETGGAKCWGNNEDGQLGNDSTTSSTTPIDVVALQAPIVSVAGGKYFSCFLLADGTVWCSGRNDEGQLGNGGSGMETAPTQVVGIDDAAAIHAVETRACVVRQNQTAKCWGGGGELLGDMTTTDFSTTPVDVQQTGIAQFALGLGHTCAMLTNGSIECWGANGVGQLGLGHTMAGPYNYPQTVLSINNAVSIAAATSETCVVRAGTGQVWCWGKIYGDEPQVLAGITGAEEVVGAGVGFCARLAGGSVKCFGLEGNGQLGDGPAMVGSYLSPVDVLGLTDSIDLEMGGGTVCSTTSAESVFCWGRNDYGQVGNGTMTNTDQPVQVQGL